MSDHKTIFSLSEAAGVLIKTTCVDYPGHVAVSFFLKGCNFRCPYCYNKDLVLNDIAETPLNSINELFNHLEKRKNIINHLVISGGEPLVNPYTKIIIQNAHNLGYKVKLDTNGTLPEKLEELLQEKQLKPDFIAMDLKTLPCEYSEKLLYQQHNQEKDFYSEKLKKSINLISKYPKENREWRTVLVPGLINVEKIKEMAKLLPEDASWQFANFQNTNCLDPAYNKLAPFTDTQLTELINAAKEIIPNAALR